MLIYNRVAINTKKTTTTTHIFGKPAFVLSDPT